MSASDKKKLRKELAAEMLTEKQRQEKKEAKKLKAMTISFVAIMLVVAIVFSVVLVSKGVDQSGYFYKKTAAATINGQNVSSVQMNYYLTDYLKSTYSTWKSQYGDSTSVMMGFMGIDANAPLNEQIADETTGQTLADYYLDAALAKAKSDYALYNKAMAEGFTLSTDEQTALDSNMSMMDLYAQLYGFKNADKYLQAMYGYGSTLESYTEYTKISTIASAFYNKHQSDLKYDDAAIRAYEKGKENNFTSFSYAIYTVNTSDYLEGGTKGEDGNTTYTDAEKAAAAKKAEEIAKALKTATNLEELDKKISELDINKDAESPSTSSMYTDRLYTEISSAEEATLLQKWLTEKRVENEITVIPEKGSGDDITGYSVVLFQGRNENTQKLANVRHLLVGFEGGTTAADGSKTYTQAEKDAAKAKAEKLLKEWEGGAKTEESFSELVKKNTTDEGSKETGGLYEDIHPKSNYVPNFLNWSIDKDRKVGDTGIIVSEYGYHIMYFSSFDELTYRDYMIREEMRSNDTETWYNSVLKDATATIANKKYLNLDITFAAVAS